MAATEKLAVSPFVTLCDVGCVVIAGFVIAGTTVNNAALLVTAPPVLVTTTE